MYCYLGGGGYATNPKSYSLLISISIPRPLYYLNIPFTLFHMSISMHWHILETSPYLSFDSCTMFSINLQIRLCWRVYIQNQLTRKLLETDVKQINCPSYHATLFTVINQLINEKKIFIFHCKAKPHSS